MPIITVFCGKGSAGKTPIATNIALEREYAIGTNEPYHVLGEFIPDDELISVDIEEPFPKIPKDKINIVFDLAGSISNNAHSITSAIKQSDLVLIPIYNEIKCIVAGLHSVMEAQKINKNIVVIATKLQKKRGEVFTSDWTKSQDFLNVQKAVHSKIDPNILVLPLKFSTAFDAIFEKEKSISQIMAVDPLLNNAYGLVNKQFNNILNLIDKYHAQ